MRPTLKWSRNTYHNLQLEIVLKVVELSISKTRNSSVVSHGSSAIYNSTQHVEHIDHLPLGARFRGYNTLI